MNNIGLYLANRVKKLTAQASKKYELIETITVSETGVHSISRTVEPNGDAYNFDKIIVKINNSAVSETAANIIVSAGSKATFINGITTSPGGGANMFYILDRSEGINDLMFSSVELSGNPCTIHSNYSRLNITSSKISSLTVSSGSPEVPFPEGCKIQIMAVRC